VSYLKQRYTYASRGVEVDTLVKVELALWAPHSPPVVGWVAGAIGVVEGEGVVHRVFGEGLQAEAVVRIPAVIDFALEIKLQVTVVLRLELQPSLHVPLLPLLRLHQLLLCADYETERNGEEILEKDWELVLLVLVQLLLRLEDKLVIGHNELALEHRCADVHGLTTEMLQLKRKLLSLLDFGLGQTRNPFLARHLGE
jgi:hypothetical protein